VTINAARGDIQGLRAFAVTAVTLFHFKIPGFEGGYIGVDVFFVISGFLMTSIIMRKVADGSFSYWDFLSSRAARIYPPMLALVMAVLVLGFFFLSPADYKTVAKRAIAAAASVSNVAFYNESLDYFAAPKQGNWLLHLWSLSLECQFYLLYPLLLWAMCRAKRLPVRGFLLVLAAASLAASIALTPHHQSAAFFLLPTRIWEFIAGGLVWAYADRLPARSSPWAFRAGLAMIALSIVAFRETMAFPGWIALIPVTGTALVIAARHEAAALSNPLTQFIGAISYSLYLWHWPIWVAAQHYHLPETEFTPCLLLMASIGVAAASYYLIERPSSALRHRQGRRVAVMWATGAGFAMVAACASAVVVNRGYPDRAPEIIRDVIPHFESDIVKFSGPGICFLGLGQGPSDFTDKCFSGKRPGAHSTVFVWGDSYAIHFGFGLAAASDDRDINVIGTTSPGCFPVLDAPSKFNVNCAANNRRTIQEIERIKPSTVVLGGRWIYAETDAFDIAPALTRTVDFLLAQGIKVVVVGPNPEWMPTLPQILLQASFSRGGAIPDRLPDASQKDGWVLDQRISDALAGKGVKYVSLYKLFCSAEGCRTTVQRDGRRELVVYDYGHLTVPAATFIVSSSITEADLR
jgi:peptidoglycan/LPS O-acetylase OafA/YrhL